MPTPDADTLRRDQKFVCAICQGTVGLRWDPVGRWQTLPPLCRGCESRWGRKNMPPDGSFRDRRKVAQIGALVEALHSEASIKKWEARYHARA